MESMKPLPFILMPDSKVLSVWNIIMMLLLLYTATYIPFKTAFIEESSSLVNTIEFSIDSLFFVDLVVNFISAFETNYKNIEFRFSRIAFTYMRTWFLFDLVSCIPFQYLDFSSSETIGTSTTPIVPADSTDGRLLYGYHFGSRLLEVITRTPVRTETFEADPAFIDHILSFSTNTTVDPNTNTGSSGSSGNS